ncbi:MAG: hypothetical protein LBR07_05820 [Puniceicoccales bacterium]|nr:hypothetical protein [Puniceicoccales bacterium]
MDPATPPTAPSAVEAVQNTAPAAEPSPAATLVATPPVVRPRRVAPRARPLAHDPFSAWTYILVAMLLAGQLIALVALDIF